MTSQRYILLFSAFLLAFLNLSPALRADVIKLKNGDVLNGRITYEADDIVKIEISISESIKETKILARGDILNIVKDAPDDVEFNKLQKLVPTPSLVPAASYRSMLETGPASFLRAYPESRHVAKVKEIKATLEEELDKVERGFIKVEEDWISPQEKAEFEMLVTSRIRLLRMKSMSSSGNYNGYINAMREFEALEENFYGTPAFPEAVVLARQVIPALGQRLQGMKRDVEYRNTEFERNKAAMDETARAQVEAARERENRQYEAALAADKKQGIKWVRLNPRSSKALESYLSLASGELKRVQEYDVEALKEQSEKLEQVDRLTSEGKLDIARAKLTDAATISGKKSDTKSKSRSKKSGTYLSMLNAKINERMAEESARKKAREEAAKSEALTANLKGGEDKPEIPTTEAPATEASEETEKQEPKPAQDAFAALAKSKKKAEKKAPSKSKTSSTSKSKPSSSKDSEREERPRTPSASSGGGGGGLPPFLIPGILVVVLLVAVGFKYLGIGGKKEE